VRDGDHYVINGRKWWTSGAGDPRCEILIFMGKTDPTAALHSQQSMILVPIATPGVRRLRQLHVFGYDHAPHGHSQIDFVDVRVPVQNLLLGEGRGFEIAQGRLGPGRIHHCMRLIGLAERALEMMCKRAQQRVAFGRRVSEQGVTLERIAEIADLDRSGSMAGPECRLFDGYCGQPRRQEGNRHDQGRRAQHGLPGHRLGHPGPRCRRLVSDDFPLAAAYAGARTLRFADGPDEVHREQIGKLELSRHRI